LSSCSYLVYSSKRPFFGGKSVLHGLGQVGFMMFYGPIIFLMVTTC
jgi:hypothetical protein